MDVAAVADAAILVVFAELELDVMEVKGDALAELWVQAPERAQEEPHLRYEARLARRVQIERAPVEPVQAAPRAGPRRRPVALVAHEASHRRPAHGVEEHLLRHEARAAEAAAVVDVVLGARDELLGREREYVQLHRDTTVASLTLAPALKGGVVVWEDSPLVVAARRGHLAVLDGAHRLGGQLQRPLGLAEARNETGLHA